MSPVPGIMPIACNSSEPRITIKVASFNNMGICFQLPQTAVNIYKKDISQHKSGSQLAIDLLSQLAILLFDQLAFTSFWSPTIPFDLLIPKYDSYINTSFLQ
jgi:hypothetical protein